MKRIVAVLIVLFIASCSNELDYDFQYFVQAPSAEGEFFDALKISDSVFVAGTRWTGNKKGFEGELLFTTVSDPEVKNFYFGTENNEMFHSVLKVKNGLLLTGTKLDTNTNYLGIWAVKTNLKGKKIWEKIYTFPQASVQGVKAVAFDSCIIILGQVFVAKQPAMFYLVKINSKGEILSQKAFNLRKQTLVKDLVKFRNGFLITGAVFNNAINKDLFLARFNSDLDTLWLKEKHLFLDDIGTHIATDGENIFVAGMTRSKGSGLFDLWLLKFDSDGKFLKDVTLGTAKNEWPVGLDFTKGKIKLAGASTADSTLKLFLIKLNPDLKVKKEQFIPNKGFTGINKVKFYDRTIIGAGFYTREKKRYGWFFITDF